MIEYVDSDLKMEMLRKLFRNEAIDASETFIYIFITTRIL